MMESKNLVERIVLVVAFAIVGSFVAYFVGIFVMMWAGRFGSQDGWEDLVAVVMAMLSFAPVGAIFGAALGYRRNGEWLWTTMPPKQRRYTVGGALILAFAVGVVGSLTTDAMSAVFLAVWALPIGAAVGFILGRPPKVIAAGVTASPGADPTDR
jgi:hypothetical protein